MAKRPNGRLAQVLGTPVKFPSDSRAIAIPWHRSSSSQKALWCRGALRVGGVRWAVEVSLGLSLKLLFCNPFSNLPKPDLLQLSLPQPGHQHLLHCALRLGSFGTSWITCTSLIPWATSCSPKTARLICFTCFPCFCWVLKMNKKGCELCPPARGFLQGLVHEADPGVSRAMKPDMDLGVFAAWLLFFLAR